jgi:membrane protein
MEERMASLAEQTRSRFDRLPRVAAVKRVVDRAKRDDVQGLSAEIAFHWIFAIPPLLMLAFVLAAAVESLTQVEVAARLQREITARAPADTASVFNRLVDHAISEVNGGLASFGVVFATVLAVWSGSNGVNALVKAFNRIFAVDEERPALRKRAVCIGLTLLLITFLNGAFLTLVYGRRIGGWMAHEIGMGATFERAASLARWPLALAGIVVVLGILYWLGPNSDMRFEWISVGSVVATALWLLLTLGFDLYLRFSNPGSAYGVLGGVIVLMFFLYLTAMVILIGAEVNAVLLEPESGSTQQEPASSRLSP